MSEQKQSTNNPGFAPIISLFALSFGALNAAIHAPSNGLQITFAGLAIVFLVLASIYFGWYLAKRK